MLTKIVSKGRVFAIIVALSLASISATSVFAAGQAHRDNSIRSADLNLASEWKAELAAFRADRFMDNSVVKWATEWKESKRSADHLSLETRFADQAALDLRRAEILIEKHPGFNAEGKVINRELANHTLQTLLSDLHTFHVELTAKLRALFA